MMNDEITIRVEPCNITYISRIMEGYEYLGVVTTLDRAAGLVRIRTTADTKGDTEKILRSLSIYLEFINNEDCSIIEDEHCN